MKRHIFYQHVRSPLNKSKFIGTVAVVIPDIGPVLTGFSQCHPTDNFSPKVGKAKAIGRALARKPPENKKGEFLKPTPFITYRPNGTKIRNKVIETALANLMKDALEAVNGLQNHSNKVEILASNVKG